MSILGKIYGFVLGKIVRSITVSGRVERMNATKRIGPFKCPKDYENVKFEYEGSKFQWLKKKERKTDKVIYYIHGGAFLAGLIPMYHKMGIKFSEHTGADILFSDYRLAPKYVYPCALEDVQKGWKYLMEQGYRAENIVLAGDSAGGNLVLALMLSIRDQGDKMPCCGVGISPWGDMTASGESYRTRYNEDVMFGKRKGQFTEEVREKMINGALYTYGMKTDRRNPLVSPIFGNYHGFPSMYFINGDDEILLSDAITIKEKLEKEGIEVKHDICKGMFHAFPIFGHFKEAKDYQKRIIAYMNEQFRKKA